jgi:hypothetical protein
VIERGYATPEELKAGHAKTPGKTLPRKLTPDVVQAGLTRSSFFRQQQGPQRFKPGDRVRTKNIHPATHTRLPRYARGKLGMVELCHGCHMYPDAIAATIRNGSTRWYSPAKSFGARTPTRRSKSRSTRSSRILSRPSRVLSFRPSAKRECRNP